MKLNRRSFLGMTALGLSAPLLPFAATPKKKLGVALLGLGRYSQQILGPAIQMCKHCELRGIVTGSPEKVPAWRHTHGIAESHVYSYDNFSDIANNPDIDVVYVVTPTATHLSFVEQAANAGKHVWCEKPMAMTVAECQRMIAVCKKNGVKLSIGYRMQHEPNTRTMAAFTAIDPLGAITKIDAFAGYAGSAREPEYWRMQRHMGGGALYDMGVYPINGARFLYGKEPIAVKASIEKAPGFDNVDSSTYFTMRFDNGVEAECGTSVVKHMNHLRMTCTNGWYELRPMQAYSGVTGATSIGGYLPAYRGNQQTLQMDNDALAILNDTPVLVPGSEGLADIRIIEAALKSAYGSQEFVEV